MSKAMGTDIDAAFGHTAEFPPTEALARSMCARIRRVSPLIHNDWRLNTDYHHGLGLFLIQDSDGLTVWLGQHAALISSGYGWPEPGEDADEKEFVTTAMRAVARYFRSPRLIFLPDDIEPWCDAERWIVEGASIEELQQKLAGIGPPSPNLKAAIRQGPESWQVDGYVVEQLTYEPI
jgi:hypothetical protein